MKINDLMLRALEDKVEQKEESGNYDSMFIKAYDEKRISALEFLIIEDLRWKCLDAFKEISAVAKEEFLAAISNY